MLAVFVVENIFDSGPGSLRQAILDANDAPGADEIVFDATLFSSSQTILLASQLPIISDDLTLTGPGKELLTIDAQQNGRIFEVSDDNSETLIDVYITGMTLTGGQSSSGGAISSLENLTLSKVKVLGNTSSVWGGGVVTAYGTLKIIESTIANNTSGHWGGGIYSYNPGTLVVADSYIANNTAAMHNGGGIFSDGVLSISTTTITENRSLDQFGWGGGLFISGHSDISDSLISNNSASRGGGVANRLGLTTISNTTISGNSASYMGGGIATAILPTRGWGTTSISNSAIVNNNAGDYGGGVFNGTVSYEGGTEIVNSTVSENTANFGGGIFSTGTTAISHSTVAVNTAYIDGGGVWSRASEDKLTAVESTIIAGNSSPASDDVHSPLEEPPAFESLGYNLIGTGDAVILFANNDQSGILDPMLGPLADNGGPTMTHALLPGSPAINAGDPSIGFDPEEFDQRGEPFYRVSGGRIDIGSYEVQYAAAPSADFNGDGIVDGFDFLAWQRGFGMSSGAAHADGDANGDEAVDGEDLAIWEQEFGIETLPVATLGSAFQEPVVDEVEHVLGQHADSSLPFWMVLPFLALNAEPEFVEEQDLTEPSREQAFSLWEASQLADEADKDLPSFGEDADAAEEVAWEDWLVLV